MLNFEAQAKELKDPINTCLNFLFYIFAPLIYMHYILLYACIPKFCE